MSREVRRPPPECLGVDEGAGDPQLKSQERHHLERGVMGCAVMVFGNLCPDALTCRPGSLTSQPPWGSCCQSRDARVSPRRAHASDAYSGSLGLWRRHGCPWFRRGQPCAGSVVSNFRPRPSPNRPYGAPTAPEGAGWPSTSDRLTITTIRLGSCSPDHRLPPVRCVPLHGDRYVEPSAHHHQRQRPSPRRGRHPNPPRPGRRPPAGGGRAYTAGRPIPSRRRRLGRAECAPRLEITLPTGDAEMLEKIRNRCHDINTRVAGMSCRLQTTFPRG